MVFPSFVFRFAYIVNYEFRFCLLCELGSVSSLRHKAVGFTRIRSQPHKNEGHASHRKDQKLQKYLNSHHSPFVSRYLFIFRLVRFCHASLKLAIQLDFCHWLRRRHAVFVPPHPTSNQIKFCVQAFFERIPVFIGQSYSRIKRNRVLCECFLMPT